MRLYSGQIRLIAEEILTQLGREELIEFANAEGREEAILDVVGVLKEYNRMDRELGRRAKDMTVGEGGGSEMRMKRRLAKEKGFRIGDDAVEYVISQMIEMFEQSNHVEEIYGTDRDLRAVMNVVMKKHLRDRSDEIDAAVRSKIKNLEEGSTAWEVEYERVMQRVKRVKGLDDG